MVKVSIDSRYRPVVQKGSVRLEWADKPAPLTGFLMQLIACLPIRRLAQLDIQARLSRLDCCSSLVCHGSRDHVSSLFDIAVEYDHTFFTLPKNFLMNFPRPDGSAVNSVAEFSLLIYSWSPD